MASVCAELFFPPRHIANIHVWCVCCYFHDFFSQDSRIRASDLQMKRLNILYERTNNNIFPIYLFLKHTDYLYFILIKNIQLETYLSSNNNKKSSKRKRKEKSRQVT